MSKTEMIRVRMESELKKEAEKIFSELDLTPMRRLSRLSVRRMLVKGLLNMSALMN